jgi:hypothetical protein
LNIAAGNGALPMMIQLLDAGAPTDVFGPQGASAVVAAVLSGHARVLDVLISGGVDVNRAMDNGATPISLAAQLGQVETISILAARGADAGLPRLDGATPLMVAVSAREAAAVKALLSVNAPVNARFPSNGATALLMAAQRGDEILLGADRSCFIQTHRFPPTISEDDAACPIQRKLGVTGGCVKDAAYGRLRTKDPFHIGHKSIRGVLLFVRSKKGRQATALGNCENLPLLRKSWPFAHAA